MAFKLPIFSEKQAEKLQKENAEKLERKENEKRAFEAQVASFLDRYNIIAAVDEITGTSKPRVDANIWKFGGYIHIDFNINKDRIIQVVGNPKTNFVMVNREVISGFTSKRQINNTWKAVTAELIANGVSFSRPEQEITTTQPTLNKA